MSQGGEKGGREGGEAGFRQAGRWTGHKLRPAAADQCAVCLKIRLPAYGTHCTSVWRHRVCGRVGKRDAEP